MDARGASAPMVSYRGGRARGLVTARLQVRGSQTQQTTPRPGLARERQCLGSWRVSLGAHPLTARLARAHCRVLSFRDEVSLVRLE